MTDNYWLLRRAFTKINIQTNRKHNKENGKSMVAQPNHKFTGYKQWMPLIDVCFICIQMEVVLLGTFMAEDYYPGLNGRRL